MLRVLEEIRRMTHAIVTEEWNLYIYDFISAKYSGYRIFCGGGGEAAGAWL
jgi:hypothetical protein